MPSLNSYSRIRNATRFRWSAPKRKYAWRKWPTSSRPMFKNVDGVILESSDPSCDVNHSLDRMVPIGMTEHNLLIALNNGNIRSLQRFPQIGPRIAENILHFRENEGYITSIDELVRVPLIGDKRFRKLTGRVSDFYQKRLHALLLIPLDQDISLSQLRPTLWPAPGLARLYLARDAEVQAEKKLCLINGHHWRSHRIGSQYLCFHFSAESPVGWAKYISKNLPRALRKVVS